MSKKSIKERKTVLFRSITRFWDFKKPRYLENRVVREPRKRRSALHKENKPVMPLAGSRGGGQITPITILLAHPDLKT